MIPLPRAAVALSVSFPVRQFWNCRWWRRLAGMVLGGVGLLGGAGLAGAQEGIRVAVASNFLPVLRDIAARFETATGGRVVLIAGSTGKLYAQIVNGAPFDVFFAADVRRPEQLERAGRARPATRFTYAFGKLVLWSAGRFDVDDYVDLLTHGRFRRLAVAQPKLAPYGRAAQEVITALGLDLRLRGRLVWGESVAQVYQFVHSHNAEWGFLAWSQVYRQGEPVRGSYWLVPQTLYRPIAQQAVLLQDKGIARQFLAFVRQEAAVKIILSYGYGVP